VRRPLSIKIAIALWFLELMAPLVNGFLHRKSLDLFLITAAISVVLTVYYLTAQWRMSRWPIIIWLALGALGLLARHAANPHWLDRYPILGIFAVLIPIGLPAALILPHWRKLNWNFFGWNDKALAPNPADVF
jgi:hypothetical protein